MRTGAPEGLTVQRASALEHYGHFVELTRPAAALGAPPWLRNHQCFLSGLPLHDGD